MVVVVVFGEKGELDSNLGLSVGRRVIYTRGRRPFFLLRDKSSLRNLSNPKFKARLSFCSFFFPPS